MLCTSSGRRRDEHGSSVQDDASGSGAASQPTILSEGEMNWETNTFDEPLVPELAADLGWQGLMVGDYACAVVRLATVIQAQINYLVWAGVELLPGEIRPP